MAARGTPFYAGNGNGNGNIYIYYRERETQHLANV
jgi:hypothetical protein